MNDTRDNASDGAWLTYRQLAEVRGISPRATVRMTQRHRLRRQPGNDGQVRVWVPHDMATPSPRTSQHDDRADDASDNKGSLAGALAALEAGLATLRERRAEAAEQGRERAEQRADRLDLVIHDERGRVIAVEAKLTAAEQRADGAEADARELRAHAAALQLQLAETTAAARGAEELRRQAQEGRGGPKTPHTNCAPRSTRSRPSLPPLGQPWAPIPSGRPSRGEAARQAGGLLARLRGQCGGGRRIVVSVRQHGGIERDDGLDLGREDASPMGVADT